MSDFQLPWLVLAVLFIVDMCSRIIAIIVIPRNRRPTAATAWLMAIWFMPLIGWVVFFAIGSPRLPRARRQKQQRINEYLTEISAQLAGGKTHTDAPEWFQSLVGMNHDLGALPLTGQNTAQLIGDYNASLEAMTQALDRAQHFAHVEFYIMQLDEATTPFFDAMARAVQRGVTVRVLFDHWGNMPRPYYKATIAKLNEIGVEWHLMLPFQPLSGKLQRPDLRNHRKLLVIDDHEAYVGSQNIIDASYNQRGSRKRDFRWVDLMVHVTGPVVSSLNAVFLSDWYSETDEVLLPDEQFRAAATTRGRLDAQVVPSGPGFDQENNLRLFLALIYGAERQIQMVSPYFVPDEALLMAVTTACARGVDVNLYVSEQSDQAMVHHAQRSYYEALLAAGVRIWLYPKPYILHTKTLTIDDDVAVVGSSNMDMRSFGLNLEVSMLVRGKSFVNGLREIEAHYRSVSHELTPEEWAQQPLRSTILDNLARLTSALQ